MMHFSFIICSPPCPGQQSRHPQDDATRTQMYEIIYIYLFLIIGMMVTHLTTVVFLHHRPEDGRTTSRNVGANIPFEHAEVCVGVPPPPFFLN
jgi:hypothetical protein